MKAANCFGSLDSDGRCRHGAGTVRYLDGRWPGAAVGNDKDAPFSADLIYVNDQINGQPGIKTEFHGKVARNSQGESYFAMERVSPVPDSPRPMRITITDPAALDHYHVGSDIEDRVC